ncbi:MAG: ATP-binding cassette domain-containing protein [Candidatus Marinimicrobia bacterium]|nr:ATP-binding cassette domain-containing protein [Candidatus Neomarinimicrobiota bacterium]
MIEVKGLSKQFGDIRAVDDLTFQVKKGEILGFLGPNAAGKTTTMRIITGFIPSSNGTVSVAGFDVFHDSMEVKRRIGYLPENPPLYQDMRVEDYLEFVATIKGVNRRSVNTEIYRVAEKSTILPVMDSYIATLSKGFKQRVGIAQALIGDPPVLILDEPTVGLDPRQIIEVRELIKNLAHEHTVILSTHILPEVSMICDRVVIINEGRLVVEDTPENLTARLKGSETIRVEVEGPSAKIMNVLQAIPEIHSVICTASRDGGISEFSISSNLGTDIRRELAATIVKNGWGLLGMKMENLSLEDIFLKLTTSEEGMN